MVYYNKFLMNFTIFILFILLQYIKSSLLAISQLHNKACPSLITNLRHAVTRPSQLPSGACQICPGSVRSPPNRSGPLALG